MTTVINTPQAGPSESGNNVSVMIMFMLAVAAIALVAYLLVPLLRRGSSMPSVNVPDKIDVNVNTPK